MKGEHLRTFVRNTAAFVGVFIAYYVAASFGLTLATVHPSASPVWAPTGIAIASLLILGYRAAPAIFLGALAANIAISPVSIAFAIAVGNTLEGLAAAWLVNRFAEGQKFLRQAWSILVFFLLAALSATLLSATIGVSAIYLAGLVEFADVPRVWLTWWLGDAAGAMIVTPLIVIWVRKPRMRFTSAQWVEVGCLYASILFLAFAIFSGTFPWETLIPPGIFLVPIFAWAAVRFGVRETATTLIVFGAFAISGTASGVGPFYVPGEVNTSLLALQIYIGSVSITALMLAAAIRERIRVMNALAEANTAKSDFLAALGHELRNPLANVMTQVQVMQLAAVSAEERDETLGKISEQANRMKRLLDDLLDIARIERGKVVLQNERLDLRTVVQAAEDNVRAMMEERSHDFMVSVPSEPVPVVGDPVRLEQIVVNILENAAKYTERGGQITLALEKRGRSACTIVKDSGRGIAPELLPRVFEPFVRVHADVQRQEGLGIGLNIVKILAELHGGTVRARSAGVGKGSEFIVELPIAR